MTSFSSCVGTGKNAEVKNESSPVTQPEKPIEKQPEPKIIYDKSDPFWQQKQEIDRLIPLLAGSSWKDREDAEQKLVEFIIGADSSSLDYFIIQSSKNNDPEIHFRVKNVLKAFFRKTIYDPDRKKGFIGLQLQEQGPFKINNENYLPIRVVMPTNGFPGQKAGIVTDDLILGVDGKICSRKFTMNDFIMHISSLKPGTEIKLILFSKGKVLTKKIILAARPESVHELAPKKSEKELFNEWYNRKKLEINTSN